MKLLLLLLLLLSIISLVDLSVVKSKIYKLQFSFRYKEFVNVIVDIK